MLWEFANGIDHSEVQPEQSEAKGVGNSTTLSEDAATVEEAMKVFYKLAKKCRGKTAKSRTESRNGEHGDQIL